MRITGRGFVVLLGAVLTALCVLPGDPDLPNAPVETVPIVQVQPGLADQGTPGSTLGQVGVLRT